MKINEFDIYYKINTEETKTRIFGSVFVKIIEVDVKLFIIVKFLN